MDYISFNIVHQFFYNLRFYSRNSQNINLLLAYRSAGVTWQWHQCSEFYVLLQDWLGEVGLRWRYRHCLKGRSARPPHAAGCIQVLLGPAPPAEGAHQRAGPTSASGTMSAPRHRHEIRSESDSPS